MGWEATIFAGAETREIARRQGRESEEVRKRRPQEEGMPVHTSRGTVPGEVALLGDEQPAKLEMSLT